MLDKGVFKLITSTDRTFLRKLGNNNRGLDLILEDLQEPSRVGVGL